MITPTLDLDEIQGDLLVGMQKNAELFVFFKIVDASRFKTLASGYLASQVTSLRRARERDETVARRKQLGETPAEPWLGLNLGFTKDGMTQLLGPRRPVMEPAFERGAAHPDTITLLNDPPVTT